jgi:hypothetical protein
LYGCHESYPDGLEDDKFVVRRLIIVEPWNNYSAFKALAMFPSSLQFNYPMMICDNYHYFPIYAQSALSAEEQAASLNTSSGGSL